MLTDAFFAIRHLLDIYTQGLKQSPLWQDGRYDLHMFSATIIKETTLLVSHGPPDTFKFSRSIIRAHVFFPDFLWKCIVNIHMRIDGFVLQVM